MILYEKKYEREGNDSWLIDFVRLHYNSFGLYLEHKLHWNGWNGVIKENHTLELDVNNLDKSQEILNEYIDDNSLYRKFPNGDEEGIVICLNNLFENMQHL
jgi:hypothetical protein